MQYNTKSVKRHVAVASEALANRTVKKHRSIKYSALQDAESLWQTTTTTLI